jgi:hypothetical protein
MYGGQNSLISRKQEPALAPSQSGQLAQLRPHLLRLFNLHRDDPELLRSREAETMFFTHLGRVVAILVLIGATFQIALALLVANEVIGPYQETLARYFPGKSGTGQVIDRGIYYLAFSNRTWHPDRN